MTARQTPAATQPKVAIPGVAEGTPQALPTTAAGIGRLRAKGRELSNQLNSASGRREDVVREMRSASADARPGLEAQLKVLDDRIVTLEQEIAANSRAIANSPPELVSQPDAATSARRSGPDPAIVVPIAGIVGVFGCLPIAIAFTVRTIRRSRVAPAASARDAAQDERLARMEQSMDAMAIELERITEGQRFVTKLMAEANGRALGAGNALAEPLPIRESVRQDAR